MRISTIYQSKLSFISFVGMDKLKGLKEQMQQTLVTKWKKNMQGNNKIHKICKMFAWTWCDLGLRRWTKTIVDWKKDKIATNLMYINIKYKTPKFGCLK